MRHIVKLGIRGVLLELGGWLLRLHGALHYRRRLRRRERQTNALAAARQPG